MCELLIKAEDSNVTAPDKQRFRWRRGMIVNIQDDGFRWGRKEGLPKFVLIKIPGVSKTRAAKYLAETRDAEGEMAARRTWVLRWADLPVAARNKFRDDGEITIKVGGYAGAYDYTWAQVRGYFRDQVNGTNEATDL